MLNIAVLSMYSVFKQYLVICVLWVWVFLPTCMAMHHVYALSVEALRPKVIDGC